MRSRVRRSAGEWSALVEACERSGLSRREFGKREGLHLGTFAFWASRLAPKQTSEGLVVTGATSSFVPVRVRRAGREDAHAAVTPSRAVASDKVEIAFANGRRVRCQLSQVGDPRLAALLALAEGVR